MVSVHTAWLWYDQMCRAVDSVFSDRPNDIVPDWLRKLAEDLDAAFIDDTSGCVWDVCYYITGLASRAMSTQPGGPECQHNESTRHETIRQLLLSIILYWFEFPASSTKEESRNFYQDWQVQGEFIHTLLSEVGSTDILLLDVVWTCFCSVRRLVLDVKDGEGVGREEWIPLKDHLRIVFSDTTREGGQLARVALSKYGHICDVAAPSPMQLNPFAKSTHTRDEQVSVARAVLFLNAVKGTSVLWKRASVLQLTVLHVVQVSPIQRRSR